MQGKAAIGGYSQMSRQENSSSGITREEQEFLRKNLSRKDLESFFHLASVAGTYEAVTRGIPHAFEGTHQFVRDIEIAQLLQSKFPNMPYDSAEGFKAWLQERLEGSVQSRANALSRLQGDGAGEVDFIREMAGELRSLFTKIDYARGADGQIASNIPGIDAVEINRFTGKIINEFQIKTLRSSDSIPETLKAFLENKDYNPNITLVGPKELVDAAKAQGLPNPTKVMGTLQENAESARALETKVQSGAMLTELTPAAVAQKMAGGAAIGAVLSLGISSLFSYIAYKQGKISKDAMLRKIGKDTAKGAITGGAMAGLSLFIPGGVIGFGIGFVVGSTLRLALDNAFGDGLFAEVLDLTRSVQANVKLLHQGSIYMAELVEADGRLMSRSLSVVEELRQDRLDAIQQYQLLERTHHPYSFPVSGKSAAELFDHLDLKRK
jgi:hypothetical protein